MNFNLQKVSTHLSDPIMEILRIQLQNTGQPQSEEKKKKERKPYSPRLGSQICYPFLEVWEGPLRTRGALVSLFSHPSFPESHLNSTADEAHSGASSDPGASPLS